MSDSQKSLDEICINTIRMLSAEAVQKANSGHPGLPLGAAAMAYVLWTKIMRYNPANPRWADRDRFVLSAGHGSALLYSMLHLTGYDLPLDEIKNFRQWGSKTAGHPEYDIDVGIECTTGPLGQGFGMGVGMALAERFLAARFNRPDCSVVDHFTYAIVSDGDLMEGVSSEAASLAGHLKLGKLIYLYDDNHISIEGSTDIAFTEDVGARFEAYHWHVQHVSDGNDVGAIESAIRAAQEETDRPSLIKIRTHIGFGSPKQDSASAHGEPLGKDALHATKEFFKWPQEPAFYIPDDALAHFRKAVERGREHEDSWKARFSEYGGKYAQEAEAFDLQTRGELPAGWDSDITRFTAEDGPMATRAASGKVLNAIAPKLPNLLGGSADLAPSNKTIINDESDQSADNPGGRNIRFGVREHGMGAVVNGMALHAGVIPYGGTFLIFSDYMRPALRLSALMNTHSIFVYTHDSLGVGEDGPTHQPVEQLASLRAMPNMTVIRPADANETAEAWRLAIERAKPVALVLTRQKLPVFDREAYGIAEGVAKGAYVFSDVEGEPDLLLIGTGSEVPLLVESQKKLAEDHGIRARVISMPSWEIFAEQSPEYQEKVFPPQVGKRLSAEAGTSFGWHRWIGRDGDAISVDRFGASAPGGKVLREYGFSVENVVERAIALVQESKK
jgi:transketolase